MCDFDDLTQTLVLSCEHILSAQYLCHVTLRLWLGHQLPRIIKPQLNYYIKSLNKSNQHILLVILSHSLPKNGTTLLSLISCRRFSTFLLNIHIDILYLSAQNFPHWSSPTTHASSLNRTTHPQAKHLNKGSD